MSGLLDIFSDSVGIRTQDPQLRRLLLYPTELPNPYPVFNRECKDITIFYFFIALEINSIAKTIDNPIMVKIIAERSCGDVFVRVSNCEGNEG